MSETRFLFRDEDEDDCDDETRRDEAAEERLTLPFLIFIEPTVRTTGGRILSPTLFFSILRPFVSPRRMPHC